MSRNTKQKWTARWEQLLGSVKQAWGFIIGDPLVQIEGDRQRWMAQNKERLAARQEKIEQNRIALANTHTNMTEKASPTTSNTL